MTNGYLLISDLDDTLLGDDSALARFRDYAESLGDELALVYASGRFFESIREDVDDSPLPSPAMVIGGVGSEVRTFPDGTPDPEWVRQISRNWSAPTVRQALENFDGLRLQAEEDQSDFKVSYHWPAATPDDLDRVRQTLESAGIAASLIYSSARDLDVLPKGVDKGSAAAFVGKRLGYPPERILAAGNSGNDAALMRRGFCGIVVGNAHSELRKLAEESESIHLSEKSYADGVIEGIKRWERK